MARNGSVVGNNSTPRISASVYWFGTINGYKDEEIQQIVSILDEKCDLYVCEKEIGASGNKHLQLKIKLKSKGRPSECIWKAAHWEKSKGWKGCEYCWKDGTELGVDIWCKGVDPVLKPKIYGWQQSVVDMLPEMKPRNIYWFFEEKGGVGKTDLCRYLCLLDKKYTVMVGGKASDMKACIASKEDKPKLVIINVPRCSYDYVSYQGLEEVSDGIFFSGKYESDMVIFNKPKIIVFANEPPVRDKMSSDRWCIYRIDGQSLIKVTRQAGSLMASS